ncbi:MAG: hypothetical protein KBH06_11310 [Spirochaetes bacterium]|nr:hypothetical protein [Spirochaetota bacterium]
MNFENEFIKRIKLAYTQNGFGRLLKTDIDIIVFDYLMTDLLKSNKSNFLSDGSINYQAICFNDIHKISRELKISESKVKNFN